MSPRIRGATKRLTTAAALTAAVVGCTKPNAANIALRKQVQTQQDAIGQLTRQHAADEASIQAATSRPAGAPDLSPGQLDALYTVHGLRLGRLSEISPDNTLTVHVIPTDQDGEDFKAAGTITVDAFDLTDHGRQVLHRVFGPAEAMKLWNGTGLRYEYVVPCPLPAKPTAGLTVRVTFVDALTGRSFDVQQVVKPPAE